MIQLPLPPGSTIGILGGGQLGRMLALAAARLGFDVAVLERDADSPAGQVSNHTIVGAYNDRAALAELAAIAKVVTFEFENVPAESVLILQELGCEVAPGPEALSVAQDRLAEKQFLNPGGAPPGGWGSPHRAAEAASVAAVMGAPLLMKTRREGYDGKGQRWVEHVNDAAAVFKALGGVPVILEAPAEFVRELSIIAARGRDGETAVYPLAENHHEDGILRRTLAPANVSHPVAQEAEKIAARVLKGLNYVGVVGIELFELKDGRLLVNEIAPRVHNTGHWTQDGCSVDQFEQHIRAVAGWPLGPTIPHSRVEMLNLLGDEVDGWSRLAHEPDTRIHLYGKRQAKPGRKMGHVNKVRVL